MLQMLTHSVPVTGLLDHTTKWLTQAVADLTKEQQNQQVGGLRIEFLLTLKTDSILEMPENFCQNKITAQLTNLGSGIHPPFSSF